MNEIIMNDNHIQVLFRFDWEEEKGYIVIKGIETKKELAIRIAGLPIVGAAWSNSNAASLTTGQQYISFLLDYMYINIESYILDTIYLSYWFDNCPGDYSNKKVEKIDKCFYAPFMYYEKFHIDENGEKIKTKEYMEILTKNYPEAYENVLKHNDKNQDFNINRQEVPHLNAKRRWWDELPKYHSIFD